MKEIASVISDQVLTESDSVSTRCCPAAAKSLCSFALYEICERVLIFEVGLQVDKKGHGAHARYNSWVILAPATGN